ncbi:MAG: hypothetical protein JXJ04_21565, partial [Spirochaetales bacterium]|nr:hypothetical protein [Spirochaetales bacterium]
MNTSLIDIERKISGIIETISNLSISDQLENQINSVCEVCYREKEKDGFLLYYFFAQAIQKKLKLTISGLLDDYIETNILKMDFQKLFFNYFPPIVIMKELITRAILSITGEMGEITFCDFCQ